MNERTLSISFQEYGSIAELKPDDLLLCEFAKNAMASSHSPYSGFRVGAALQLSGGLIVSGSNQENVAYPSGLCAERVALFTAGATYPGQQIIKMAITAHTDQFDIKDPVTSCGACLQVMVEYEKKQNQAIQVLFYCLGGRILKISSIKDLLPFAFAETRLKK